jgi:SAM-dependent methyltransferase
LRHGRIQGLPEILPAWTKVMLQYDRYGAMASINAPEEAYDAVFDFGIIHHVPDWRAVLMEVYRVLKPGGLFYAEEPLEGVLNLPLMHRLFAHPVEDQFDLSEFRSALRACGDSIVVDLPDYCRSIASGRLLKANARTGFSWISL